jgi:hypothetical protein
MRYLLDTELLLPITFVLLGTAGIVLAAFATYRYLRFERSYAERHVPIALLLFVAHYALPLAASYVQDLVLLPTLLLFLMVEALVLTIWFGSRARSGAGVRIALAGAFTLATRGCGIGHIIYQNAKFYRLF